MPTVLAHVAGVPLEETLLTAAPALLLCGGALGVHARDRLRRLRPSGRRPASTAAAARPVVTASGRPPAPSASARPAVVRLDARRSPIPTSSSTDQGPLR